MSRRDSFRLAGVTRQFMGRLELYVGFVSLALATLLFRIETKRSGSSSGMNQVLALLSLMTAGAFAMIVARQRPEVLLRSPSR